MIYLGISLLAIAVLGNLIPKALLKSVEYPRDAAVLKIVKHYVPIGAIITLIVATAVTGIRVIDQTEIGVVCTLGKITGTLDSGVNLINLFISTVSIYGLRIHSNEATFSSYTKDAQTIDVVLGVQYELPKENVIRVASEYGAYDALEAKLKSVSEEKTKVVISRLSAMSLMETRSKLSLDAIEEMRSLEEVFPVRFTAVIVKDLSFSDAFEGVIEQKMAAEQEALRAENVTRQKAEENKQAVAKAAADAEQVKLKADADAYSVEATSKAEAEAIQRIQTQLAGNPACIEYLKAQQWDGKLPQTMLGDGQGIILNLP